MLFTVKNPKDKIFPILSLGFFTVKGSYLIQSYANFKKACFQGNMSGEKEKKKKENTFKAI